MGCKTPDGQSPASAKIQWQHMVFKCLPAWTPVIAPSGYSLYCIVSKSHLFFILAGTYQSGPVVRVRRCQGPARGAAVLRASTHSHMTCYCMLC